MEFWKDIEGYEGLYQVSTLGRVKSMHKKKHIIVSTPVNSNGYVCFQLNVNKDSKYARLHRIIATAFISNPYNKPHVNHINGDKLDNRIENLEWVNNRENITHSKSKINKTSKYTGVSIAKGKYFSCIQINGKTIGLGTYCNEEDAHFAYKNALISNGLINKYA